MTKNLRLELTTLLVLLVIFCMLGYLALDFPQRARWLPLGTSLPGFLLVVWCFLRLFRSGEEKATAKKEVRRLRGFYGLLLTLILAVGAAMIGGFLYAVPLSFLTFVLISEGWGKLWLASLISLVATVVTYLLFGQFLGIPLTRGIF